MTFLADSKEILLQNERKMFCNKPGISWNKSFNIDEMHKLKFRFIL